MTDGSRGLETLLIGIDAACAEIVDPLREAGVLPHLDGLMNEGATGGLESQIPPWTPSAWSSIYTGVNPGKHGLYGFLKYDGYDWDVVDFTDLGELTIWEILTLQGKTSVVVNAPVTHPAGELDGALIPGYVAPSEPETHPTDVLDRYLSTGADYRVYPDPEQDPRDEYPALVEMRGDLFCYLADEFDPAFGFVQFQVTDSIFHEHPDDEELVEAVYRAVDAQIGRLLERYDPDVVIVASDHGMGRYDEYEFRVNEHLHNEGFLETTIGETGMPAWLPILEDQLRDDGEEVETTEPGLASRAIGVAARGGLTPERMGRVLRALRLDGIVSELLPATAKRAGRTQVDFPASMAYMTSRIELGIRMNVINREPDGEIPSGEYEAVRAELIESLSDVRTPDGAPVFEDVAPREAYFWGPYVDGAVDVVTVPNGFDQFLSADLKGAPFGEPAEPWNHKRDGLVAIGGTSDRIDPTTELESPHVYDLAPTVLASLGVPASDRMDGAALAPVDEITSATYPRPDREPDHGRTSEEVQERLEAIGYL